MTPRVMITGGADGIGLGIARRFIEACAMVYVCDVRLEALSQARSELPLAGALQADVSQPLQVEQLFAQLGADSGGIDVLINTVGIAGPQANVEDILCHEWNDTLAANVNGALHCIRQAVPCMKQRRAGVILNISSAGSLTVPPRRSVYNTSKRALEGLTRSRARELGPFNIRCNAILPGIMNNSRMRMIMSRRAAAERRMAKDVAAEYLHYCSMGQLIEPEEIGDLAVFLACDRARHVTSQLIAVCGGLLYEN